MGNSVVIVKRMLINDHEQCTLLRIIFIDHGPGKTWVYNIHDNSWPYPLRSDYLIDQLNRENGLFSFNHTDPHANIFQSDELVTGSDKLQRKRFNLIKPLVTGNNEFLILDRYHRNYLIKKRSEDENVSRQTIINLLKIFWKRGMTYYSLRPDYLNCGGRGKPRILKGKKVGAPRTISPGIGINIDDTARRAFRVGADYYFSKKGVSLQSAHDYIVGLFYSKSYKCQNGEIIKKEINQEDTPTLRQFHYYLRTAFTDQHIRRRRKGDKHWDLNEREILGAADGDVQGPGDRFQIDATIADVYLVSQFDRRRIVGRPVIYFVIDVFSRLIVGIYVGFEGPSWIGAMMALTNMVTPKIEYCSQYGIEINEQEWPAHYCPRRILADRGELMSVRMGQNIVTNLNIEIENTSPGRADMKSLVERRFGIVPAIFKPFVPGYVEKDFNERGVKDYRLDATLNLYEFTQLVIYAVLEHNFTPIRNLKLPAEMVTEGLTTAPIDLWKWGISNRSGALRILTIEEVALNVMPTDSAIITAKGISFKGSYYICKEGVEMDWFSKARKKSWSIQVSYDPRDLSQIFIKDSSLPNGFTKCELINKNDNNYGKSLYEIEEIDLAKKRIEAEKANERQEKRILIDAKMAKIKIEARKSTDSVSTLNISKSAKTKNIRQNRVNEKFLQRLSEQFHIKPTEPSLGTTNATVNNNETTGLNKRLEFLKNLKNTREIDTNE